MTKNQHTPTPWSVSKAASNVIIGATATVLVATCRSEDPNYRAKSDGANAAFIVRACNAHDSLVAAVGRIASIIEDDAGEREVLTITEQDILHVAKEALRLAQGEG